MVHAVDVLLLEAKRPTENGTFKVQILFDVLCSSAPLSPFFFFLAKAETPLCEHTTMG